MRNINDTLYAKYIQDRLGNKILEDDLGFIIYKINGEECFIVDTFVEKIARKCGKFDDLLCQLKILAREAGCKIISANIHVQDSGASDSLMVALHLGFKIIRAEVGIILVVKELEENKMGSFIDNTLGTNIFGENSTDKAVDAQRKGTSAGNDALSTAYGTSNTLQQPYQEAGGKALSTLSNGFGLNGQQVLQQDPGYQFRLDQGNNAINASAAARGLSNSGATMKALTRYGQDYASNEYNNAYNRQYQNLSSLAGMGQSATNNMTNIAQSYGQGLNQNYTGMGNAVGAANIAQGNQQSNLLGAGIGAAATYAGAQAKSSDIRLKTDIKPISKEDLDELKSTIKPYSFKYLEEKRGKGEWIGVMAQDLEKSKLGRTLVDTDADGFKTIDLAKIVCLLLATMGEAA